MSNLIPNSLINVKIDTSKFDRLLLDVLLQSCGGENNNEIDNRCISVYEEACDYLAEQGYIQTINMRIYNLTKRGEDAFNELNELLIKSTENQKNEAIGTFIDEDSAMSKFIASPKTEENKSND
jgi:hypothetical protein